MAERALVRRRLGSFAAIFRAIFLVLAVQADLLETAASRAAWAAVRSALASARPRAAAARRIRGALRLSAAGFIARGI